MHANSRLLLHQELLYVAPTPVLTRLEPYLKIVPLPRRRERLGEGTWWRRGRGTIRPMADLNLVRALADQDHYAVVITQRKAGGMQASVVSAGVMNHPGTQEPVVALVARGGTVKLANLRRGASAT